MQEGLFQEISQRERDEVERWLRTKGQKIEEKAVFLEAVAEALQEVKYTFQIATMEPCVKNGKLQFIEGEKLTVGLLPEEWERLCNSYAPEKGSRMATFYELILFYAWRIAKGHWRFTYVAADSSGGGNYCDRHNEYPLRDLRRYRHGLEPAGARSCGGYKDGIGNTAKLVKKGDKYKVVGGCYKDLGKKVPVATVKFFYGKCNNHTYCTPCVVLTKCA